MSLFKQVRDEIVDANVPASTVLRKAKILSASLDNKELDEWLTHELTGYPQGSTLPEYRQLKSALLGTFTGPSGSVTGYQIPVSFLPDFMQKCAEDVPMAHALRELEAMAESPAEGLRHTLPTETVVLVRDHVQMSGGLTLVEMHRPITRAMLHGIIDSVRTRFLDFLLGLQRINPDVLESESELSSLPRQQVANVFNVSVYGDHNVVAPQSTIRDIAVQSVRYNDPESLTSFLTHVGLTNADAQQLIEAIDVDGSPEGHTIGQRVTAWIGTMVGKAVSGTWSIALATAPEVLKEAVFRYYGWK